MKRRDFFKAAGSAAALSVIQPASADSALETPLTLGMASYTLRNFNIDECLKMTARLGLERISFKSFHLPLDAGSTQINEAVAKVKAAGLQLYGGGVIYMKNEQEVQQAFDYCRAAEMQIMIGVPNHELLDLVEAKAKAYDLIVAIHNHGPGDKLYPSPESIYAKIKDRDRRLGLCLDVGHVQRIALDPSEEFIKYHDRVYDIHIKDVSSSSAEGTTVEIGRGVIDIAKLLRTLAAHHYQGTLALEFEKDESDPLPGCAESIGFLRGVMAAW